MGIDINDSNFYKDKLVFITGGTGFIGSNLIFKLIKYGAKVRALRKQNSDLWRVKDVLDKIDWVYGDLSIEDENFWAETTEGVSIIFHLAADGVQSIVEENWTSLVKTNINGTLAMMYGSKKIDSVKRIIVAGSCFEYGDNNSKITTSDVLNPKSMYSASKAASTLLSMVCGKKINTEVIVLRIFHTYGPYESSQRFIPDLIVKLLAGRKFQMTRGEQVRDFCYVEDVIDAFLRAGCIDMKGLSQKILNIGSGHAASIKKIADIVTELIPNRGRIKIGSLPYRADEIWRLVPDLKETNEFLKWKAKYSIKEGLKETIDWYLKKHYA